MSLNPSRTRSLLQQCDLSRLFIEELGWSPPATGQRPHRLKLPQPIGIEATAAPIAQLGGLTVFRLDWPGDRTPGVTARRAVQRALAPTHAEHLVIYVVNGGRQLAFTWARRRGEGRIELRTLPYEAGSPARTTLERLALLQFTLAELDQYPDASPPITAVTAKLDAAFDVEAVTKQFYQEIANWYFWAREHVAFPMPKGTPNPDAYQAQSLIRLITRLIFCWFVKQKGLIPGALFDLHALAGILKNGANLPVGEETTYYKAILQNLFFATLNQEMDKRQFRKRSKDPHGRDAHRGITNLYRYEDHFADPQEFLRLMQDIPFLNGGLFECLDKVYRAEEKLPDVRIDGFSDHPKNPLQVPDFLFFSEERTVDLSAAYGERRYRQAKVRGLIHTFARYNFTITEATPLDQEVALDPELSGKVFENLLAAYNPETATTARQQTGSFYTPREIVDYMVDEALVAYFKTKVEQKFLSVAQSGTGILACESTALQTQMSVPLFEEASLSITRRNLPHWTKPGAIYWITFRLADALPQDKLCVWKKERDLWLEHHPEPWSDVDWKQYNERFGDQLEGWLDAGMGSRALSRADVREAVRMCLMRFDGERLRIHAAVIMPTHVHALIEPLGKHKLSDLMKGIKGASAREANKLLGASGRFWLDESFDHIVRSTEQYQHFLRYIAENPVKSHLRPNEYWLYLPQSDTGIPACEKNSNTNIPPCASAASSHNTDKNVCATLEQKLRHLLAYNDEPHQFTPPEVTTLIAAIDNLKALDPACGSGAFPMGLLHKLVFILSKLDPHNEQWKQKQIAKASEIPDATVREKTLADIEQAFAANELDYGRKLYLIENCIYGVDIQPIAVQIAKMRFFISLIVDQKVECDTDIPVCDAVSACASEPKQPKQPQARMPVPHWNLGIRPLPNLETKFVAANTLIGIEKPAQQMLRNPQIDAKEAELRRVRERHFTARTPATKARCREQDAKLRAEISDLLRADGFARETTEKLANWNPYDQNASADFFDPEWMFGIKVGQAFLPVQANDAQTRMSVPHSGFDIVIGNPPYVRHEEITELKPLLQAQGYTCYTGTADLYVYFYEAGIRLLRPGGTFSFITSNKWFRAAYGEKLRTWLARHTRVLQLIDFGDAPVFTAIAYPCIVIVQRTDAPVDDDANVRAFTWEPGPAIETFAEVFQRKSFALPQRELKPDGWRLESGATLRLLERLRQAGKPLGEYVNGRFYRGILTGLNEAFVVDRATRDRLIAEHPSSAEVLKPFLRGRDVKRWRVDSQDLWLIFTRRGTNIKNYPAIYEHLLPFKKRLMPGAPGGRKPGSYQWYEIQDNIAYWQEFERPKIVIPAIEQTVSYAPDLKGHYSNDKTTICVSDQINYLLSLLNSSALWWFIRATAATKQGGFYEFKPMYVGQLPIPSPSRAEHDALVKLVERILAAKRADAAADVTAWEREIDERVYRLYGLTPEEIKLVEENTK